MSGKTIDSERKLKARVISLLANDSYAASFQTLGQYRSALIKEIDNLEANETPKGQGEARPFDARVSGTQDVYCEACGGCGEDGCCSALICAKEKMCGNDADLYCEKYFKEIEFAYRLAEELYEEHADEQLFDKIYQEVYH